jgi:hypothetical protein
MLPEAETFYARSIFDEYWRLWPAGHVVDEFKLTVTGTAFIATAVLPAHRYLSGSQYGSPA